MGPFASVQALHGLSRLSAWWVALGIDLERGRPAHPQDTGGHERLHRDIALELESLGQGATPEALELWREEFNRERPHEALSGGTLPGLEQASQRGRSPIELSPGWRHVWCTKTAS
jgi:putative transposase